MYFHHHHGKFQSWYVCAFEFDFSKIILIRLPQNFVDENCASFNGEEENNFEHSRLHKVFCSIAENLLVEHLERVGITPEQFVEACQKERKGRSVNQRVWSQICAIDDFLTFKKMMAKRNMELELECIKSMRLNTNPVRVSNESERERLEIEEAIRRSREDSSKFQDEDEKEAIRRSLLESTSTSSKLQDDDDDDDDDGNEKPIERKRVKKKEEEQKLLEIEEFDISRRLEIAELQEQMAQSLVLEASNTTSAPPPSRAASRKEVSRRISKDHAEARKQVQAAFEKSSKLLSTSSEAVASIAQRAKIEVSERDIERRRLALLEQRKRLLAMKKKQRAKKLKRAKEEEEEEELKRRKKKKKKKKKKKIKEEESSRRKEEDDADLKRREMRLALLQRMKSDLRGDGIRARDSSTESKISERSKISRQLRDFEKVCDAHMDEEDDVVRRVRGA